MQGHKATCDTEMSPICIIYVPGVGCHRYCRSKHDDVTTGGDEASLTSALTSSSAPLTGLQQQQKRCQQRPFRECCSAARRRGKSSPSIMHRTGWETRCPSRGRHTSAPAAMTTTRSVPVTPAGDSVSSSLPSLRTWMCVLCLKHIVHCLTVPQVGTILYELERTRESKKGYGISARTAARFPPDNKVDTCRQTGPSVSCCEPCSEGTTAGILPSIKKRIE